MSNAKYEGWIETASGKPFSLDKPTFEIDAIAHALGQITRFNGHGKFFYSVAEHSVLVSELMQELKLGDPFEGLMHDVTEAFLSDVPAPFKQFLPDWGKIDARVELAMRAHYGLEPTKSLGCKKADWLALFIEAYDLMPSKGGRYTDPDLMREVALEMVSDGWRIQGLEPNAARAAFMKRFRKLTRKRNAA